MNKTKRNEGLLAIFLGSFGAHYFYRGKIGLGILRIMLGWGGLVILASPLPKLLAESRNSDFGFAIFFSIIFTFIGPLMMFAPIASIIAGIIEGVKILHEGDLSSKEKHMNESIQGNNNLQLGQEIVAGSTKLQDIYPTPKGNQSSSQDIDSKTNNS